MTNRKMYSSHGPDRPLPDPVLRSLVTAISDAAARVGFQRASVWTHRVIDPENIPDPYAGIAGWLRYTEEAMDRGTHNGISLFANGVLAIDVHAESSLIMVARAEQHPGVLAATLHQYIHCSEELHGVEAIEN